MLIVSPTRASAVLPGLRRPYTDADPHIRSTPIKDWKLLRIHTTFGRVYLPSPRVMSCTCNPVPRPAISPLKGWLTRSTNELRYLPAKLASQQVVASLHLFQQPNSEIRQRLRTITV